MKKDVILFFEKAGLEFVPMIGLFGIGLAEGPLDRNKQNKNSRS
jgi:hypothetical protein